MALSTAAIVLIVIGAVFLLVAIGLIIYAIIYFRRKQQEQEAKTDEYFVGKSLEVPIVATVQNGFHHHTLSNGTAKPMSNGHITAPVAGTHRTDQKKHPYVTSNAQNKKPVRRNQTPSLSIPVFPAKKQHYDEVDHGRLVIQNGHGHRQNTRGPVYVYQAPNRGQHRQQPVYVVSRQGAANKPHTQQVYHRTQQSSHTQKLDKNWNLKPTAHKPHQNHHQPQHQRQRLVTLDKYRPLEIEQSPELDRRGVVPEPSCRSMDDLAGQALYLRWSPSMARRKRESATQHGDNFQDEGVDYRWGDDFRQDRERPPSGGSYKIATNTLPMPRGNKAGLPSPIPASGQYPHKTQL